MSETSSTGGAALVEPRSSASGVIGVVETSVSGATFFTASWSVVRQTTALGEQDAAVRVAEAAGRRVVQTYGEALERLAE